MADFTIPKGKAYSFSINVKEADSFVAQDLTNLNTSTSTFELFKLSDLTLVSGTPTIAVTDAVNGVLTVSMDSTYTGSLIYERGSVEDGYYNKPTYQGVITLKFTDGTKDIVGVIPHVYIVPAVAP